MRDPGRSLRRARGGSLPERERSTPTADAPTDGLIRAQRMDAAARTTRALAHELANYLGAMRSTLYLLADDAPDDPAVREDLEVLARAHDEATELLEELRRFARPTPVGTGSADLNAVLRDVEPELNGAMRAGTTLRLSCGSEPLVVRGDAARLRLLVLDLVTTMSHSLADGGHLEVEVARAPDQGRAASALVTARGDGPGLEPERAVRIFEPFVFDKSGNSGLRLAAVYQTVVESGGAIAAESAPGAGTTIRLTLPPAVDAGENPTR